jgi:hypothetical protein
MLACSKINLVVSLLHTIVVNSLFIVVYGIVRLYLLQWIVTILEGLHIFLEEKGSSRRKNIQNFGFSAKRWVFKLVKRFFLKFH